MYNRGTPPLDATVPSGSSQLEIETQRKTVLRDDLITLGIVTLAAESMVRWGHSGKSGNFASLHITLRLILGVALELAAQYLTTLGLALGALWLRGWWPVKTREKVTHIDGRRENFLYALKSWSLYMSIADIQTDLNTPYSTVHFDIAFTAPSLVEYLVPALDLIITGPGLPSTLVLAVTVDTPSSRTPLFPH